MWKIMVKIYKISSSFFIITINLYDVILFYLRMYVLTYSQSINAEILNCKLI